MVSSSDGPLLQILVVVTAPIYNHEDFQLSETEAKVLYTIQRTTTVQNGHY